jgi:hypothetical protein
LGGVDLQFRTAPLKTGLRLGHAILDRLDAVSARKRAPRSNPEAFQDGVRIDENWTVMASHVTSQLNGGLNPVRGEEVGKVIDRQIEKCGGPSRRDASFINSQTNDFHERF